MHGNVWEWCQDWYSGSYYKELLNELGQRSEPAPSRSTKSEAESSAAREFASDNPSGPESGSYRVIRGGSWYFDAGYCRSAYRSGREPSSRGYSLGFRLSRTGPWRSYPITLGGAQPRPDAQAEPQTRSPETAPRASAAPGPTGRARYAPQEVFRDCFRIIGRDGTETPIDAPELVYLPSGTFLMGDERGGADEKPVHPVRLDAFAIGRTPVTWGDYRRFCEATDTHPPEWLEKGSQYHLDTGSVDYYRGRGIAADALDLPVVGVSWDHAIAFCAWLSEQTGEHYALPTEAQWEYACRAGTTTRWSCGDDEEVLGEHAWYAQNAGGKLHAVGQKQPNPWGLFDMHGNVWEWCSDWYASYYSQQLVAGSEQSSSRTRRFLSRLIRNPSGSEQTPCENPSGPESGSYRVFRGGSWSNVAVNCRSAFRDWDVPSFRLNYLGFRLSRTV
jgi:formylglycine-generating enzyme required for sulfatase activity